MLRRSGADADVLSCHGLTIEADAHRVSADGKTINLGQTEYRLLWFFMSNTGRVYSRAQLLDHVWGLNHDVEERTVDVHILRLRKALRDHALDHLIETVRGAGYLFTAPQQSAP